MTQSSSGNPSGCFGSALLTVQRVLESWMPWKEKGVTNLEHRARECSSADLHPELRSALARHMLTDEEIVVCIESTIVSKYDRRQEYMHAHLITDRRVISAYCGVRTMHGRADIDPATVSSMYLSDIVSVQHGYSSFTQGHNLDLETHAGRMNLEFGSKATAVKFVGIVQRAVDEIRQAAGTSPGAVADRLRELTAMHNEGLVNGDEFQRKREELLGQL